MKFRTIIAKLLSCWILNKSARKNFRNFLLYFSIIDYFRFKNQNFHIISLGNNCLPRVLTTAIKLKPRKIYGEKTCPFDLCVNNDINRITELINNDFSDFFVNLKYDNGNWHNENFVFIHDKNLTLEQFKNRYKNRINNFLYLLKSDKKLYFIYSNYDENLSNKNDINNLYYAIKTKRENKPFQLILLISKNIEGLDESIIQIVNDFKIEDSDWVKRMLNILRNDKYSDYKIIMENEFKKIIKKYISAQK
ncbi:hypothetical protein J6P92_03265 [bacterium]|nr:hypothetical protein [bacterium]